MTVNRHNVYEVPTPQATSTWCPIPHQYMMEEVEKNLDRIGMEITGEHHILDKEGARWFATLQVNPKPAPETIEVVGETDLQRVLGTLKNANQTDIRKALGTDLREASEDQVREAIVAAGSIEQQRKYALAIGVRNAHDKAFRAGLACGSHVSVCDNLCFSGEVVVGRKHTSYILRDLPALIDDAISRVVIMEKVQTERLELYQQASLSDFALHDLVIRAVDRGVIPTTRIPAVLGLWRGEYKSRVPEGEVDPVAWGEAHEAEFTESTVWRAFNAFTSVLKTSNVFDLPKKTRSLHDLCDGLVGYELDPRFGEETVN